MHDPAAFAKMVPGFDFLQGLAKSAGAAMPTGLGHWIAPTVDPKELEKRIEELRTVQFWLEQNARMLGATIQALEVQRMTLSTLETMNLSFGDLAESLKIRMPGAAPTEAAAARPAPAPAAVAPAPTPSTATKSPPEPVAATAPAAPIVPPGVIDPMQWWGALTQQFTELAANAMKDGRPGAMGDLAGAMVKQGLDAASQTLKKTAAMPMAAATGAAAAAQGVAQAAAGKPAAKRKPGAKTTQRRR